MPVAEKNVEVSTFCEFEVRNTFDVYIKSMYNIDVYIKKRGANYGTNPDIFR